MHFSKEKPSCSTSRVITANSRVSKTLGFLRYFDNKPWSHHFLYPSPEPSAHRWAYLKYSQASIIWQHFQTTFPLKPWSRFLPNFTYSIYRPGERISVFFVPTGKELWLLWVAMATFHSYNEKSEKWHLLQIFWQNVYKMFLEKYSTNISILFKPLNLSGCHGDRKAKFGKKKKSSPQ